MNLEEFVRETLVQIVNGVQAANEAVFEAGAYVNPRDISGPVPKRYCHSDALGGSVDVVQIAFDVAVTASQESQQGGKVGLTVVSVFGAGGEKNSRNASHSESRVRFEVPLILPASKAFGSPSP